MRNMQSIRHTKFVRGYSLRLDGSIRRRTTGHSWRIPSVGRDTGIRIYNCAARQQVPLVLLNENYATWYTCGPTVYDAAHLGHASCYVKLDIIQRILRQYFNINLVTAMNITDIDDKIIRKSQESGKDWREISRFYEAAFSADLRKLNVVEPNLKVRVTEYIPQIISFIEAIITKGSGYVANDGSVYFEVKKIFNYGKLQKLNFATEFVAVPNNSDSKVAAADFALWKSKKDMNEPAWESPWGAGRPGWHIECSALASLIFGQHIDFHAGGLDLKFPHHENEEAQSCVYHDTNQWVNYWLHTGHLNVKGQTEKMSKSLKNTISIDEMLSRYTADEFRMACMLSNYRNAVEYGENLMQNSRNTLQRFKTFKTDCQAYLCGKKRGANLNTGEIIKSLHNAEVDIDACLKNDFDTAGCISVLMKQISNISRCINVNVPTTSQLTTASCLDAVAAIDNFLQRNLDLFGFTSIKTATTSTMSEATGEIDLNGLLEDILQSRRIIRDRAVATSNKDLFKICDELRNCLQQHGIEIRDHSQGSSWQFSSYKE